MTTVSTAAKAVVRMSAQTKSAPSPSASRARATSRARRSMPLTWASSGASAQALGQWPWRAAWPAARDQAGEQALAAADVEDASSRRDQAVREQVAEDRIPAQLAAREVPGEAPRALVRRARLLDQGAPGERPATLRSWRCRRAAARRARRAPAASPATACGPDALEQRRQYEHGERAAGAVARARGRRAAAGCRRRRDAGPAAPGRRPDRCRRCRSRVGSSSPAAGRAAAAPAPGRGCAARPERERSAAPCR